MLLCGIAVGELLGWPFLAAPLQQQLSQRLDRRVQLTQGAGFAVRFVGHLRLRTDQLEIAAPAWSQAPHLLLAHEVELDMRWIDLWRAWQGQRLRIHRLAAGTIDAHLERQADGLASWTLAPRAVAAAASAATAELPLIGSLRPGRAVIHVRDESRALDAVGRLTRQGAAGANGMTVKWLLQAEGRLRQLPLQLELQATSDGSPAAPDGSLAPLHLKLQAHVGRGRLDYSGYVHDLLHGGGLDGRFTLQGPSLAAVGDLIGVTLPTTAAFQSQGSVVKQGSRWRVVVDDATVGTSHLNGRFVYAGGSRVPLLTGRLGGRQLMLRDLGPLVGTAPSGAASAARTRGRVLPDRRFDLAALRAMDAQVEIDIDSVDLNTPLLEALRPLRARLGLGGGVLGLSALDARTAQGRLTGKLGLDGRTDIARWTADLQWDGLRLERWIHQARAAAEPPYISGQLGGRASVHGQGRSTAEILASLQGSARAELQGGRVSQQLIEAAGIDLAESLGLLFSGDSVLPVTCAVADLAAERGVWRTRVMVLDTPDSTVWVDGSLSLASEALDLRAVVSPKDLSPLTLRSPLRVRGSLAHPVLSVDQGHLGRKLAASLLLGLLNPLAALIPLIDTGNVPAAGVGAANCHSLMKAGRERTAAR